MDDIIILDNIVSPSIQDMIEEILTNDISWTQQPVGYGTSGINNEYLKKYKQDKVCFEKRQMTFTLMNIKDLEENSPSSFENHFFKQLEYGHYLLSPLQNILANFQYKFLLQNVIRVKCNLLHQVSSKHKGKFNFPHTDIHKNNTIPKISYTAIYYVNDSDGDTFMFNEPPPLKKIEDISKLTIRKKISPKKGRMILFPSNILHAGSFPVENETRMIINYNVSVTPPKPSLNTEELLFKHFPELNLEE